MENLNTEISNIKFVVEDDLTLKVEFNDEYTNGSGDITKTSKKFKTREEVEDVIDDICDYIYDKFSDDDGIISLTCFHSKNKE